MLCNRSLARLKLEEPQWNFGFQLEQVLCSKMNAAACWSLHVPSHQKMLSVNNSLKVPDLGATWYDQDKPTHFGMGGFTLASHWLHDFTCFPIILPRTLKLPWLMRAWPLPKLQYAAAQPCWPRRVTVRGFTGRANVSWPRMPRNAKNI